MATVRVRALSRVHGLHYGEEATIRHDAMVDLLLEKGKLALIADHPDTTIDVAAPAATPETESTIVDDELADEPTLDTPAEAESTDPELAADKAPRRAKRERSGKEPDDEAT